ncbi:hypothetical protein [Halalkalicoccus salilacus]|uniref:hypothetical protein n=1 Tax=Halalkalicoccus sp. GCM10025704 TaxID=3252662 RepID=UPI003620A673
MTSGVSTVADVVLYRHAVGFAGFPGERGTVEADTAFALTTVDGARRREPPDAEDVAFPAPSVPRGSL